MAGKKRTHNAGVRQESFLVAIFEIIGKYTKLIERTPVRFTKISLLA